MLTLRSSQHLRTGRHLKSFRALSTSTGLSRAPAEQGRLWQEEAALAQRQWRRHWLVRGWEAHLYYCRLRRSGVSWVMR